MRFTIRKANKGWMVWDTLTRRVAEVDDRPSIGITEESAGRVAEMLNAQDELRSVDAKRAGRSRSAISRSARKPGMTE